MLRTTKIYQLTDSAPANAQRRRPLYRRANEANLPTEQQTRPTGVARADLPRLNLRNASEAAIIEPV